MATDRDPFFFACAHADHEGYIDDPDFTLVDKNGELILRTGEKLLKVFKGDFVLLRYPEEMWLIQREKVQNWTVYVTNERIVGQHELLFKGAFEFLDWIDEYGKFAGLHPTEEIEINEFFRWVDKKDKRAREFSLVFQIAYTRISSISCIKTLTTQPSGVEFWYDDSPSGSQTLIQIFPGAGSMGGKEIFNLAVMIQENSAKTKEKCLIKKHELDPSWEPDEYNTYLATLQRLARAPDFLAMGSPDLDEETFNPISLQPHPLSWGAEVFPRSINGTEPIRIINLKY